MTIEVQGITQEETAWDKWIHFTYEGEEYHAQLHWDKYEGYDLHFTDATRAANWIDDPEWVSKWQHAQQYGAESLEYTLDCLTNEVMEGE